MRVYSVRLGPQTVHNVLEIKKRFPVYSMSDVIRDAIGRWAAEVLAVPAPIKGVSKNAKRKPTTTRATTMSKGGKRNAS